nr:MAG TPA: hypothetical protein [Caudoviricetes sp.]
MSDGIHIRGRRTWENPGNRYGEDRHLSRRLGRLQTGYGTCSESG